jgi:radical SAM superfamily enzyme YgiQ (UPF0313 family)
LKPICFVIPPSPFLLDERVFMSLGILKISAVLERAGHVVEVLDLSGIENFEEAFKFHARRSKATIFGFTATTPQMPQAAKLACLLEEVRPDARKIVGGPHPTLTYAAYKKEVSRGISGRAGRALLQLQSVFDVVVAGDGEDAIFEAMQDTAPRVIDADDPKSPLFLTNGRLNDLPFPARHLVDVESYHYQIDGERAISLIAQLGCPFACGFCGGRNSAMLRRIRTRTTANIVSEIEHLYKTYGVRGFMMYDDELNVNTQMVELMNAIGDLQESLGESFKLRGFIKSQLFNDAQAAAMYRAGFRWILTGFESGSPRILENMNKKATREENTRCVEIARRHGLKVKALMSLGHPGESPQTIAETKDWLMTTKPNDFDVTIITPYPGSPYFDDAVEDDGKWIYSSKNGDILYMEEVNYFEKADHYKGNPNDGYTSHVWTPTLSRETIVLERDRMERDVRAALEIPFNPSAPALRFEHSMGMSALPPRILRTTQSLTNVI